MVTSSSKNEPIINIGYVPLMDCAPLIIAQKAGFFSAEGIEVKLHRESNWASIRDKLSLGMIDAAHILAPMVLASQTAPPHNDINKSFKTSLALGYNGNAITISNTMFDKLGSVDESFSNIIESLKAYTHKNDNKLILGTVHPYSMHTYLLHLLLKKAQIDSSNVEIKVIPPVQMVEAMQAGEVDLYCVGEPWNTAAQIKQAGKILCYGSELWSHAPEKVLGVNQQFASEKKEQHKKILRAIVQACQWLEAPDHMAQAALWLAAPEYLDCSSDLLIQAMINQWHTQTRAHKHRKIFFSQQANAPWPEHAQWMLNAMKAWSHTDTKNTQPDIDSAYDWATYKDVMLSLNLATTNSDQYPGVSPKIT